MNRLKHLIFSIGMLLTVASGYSQGVISGLVTDGEINEPLPGASITVKGTSKGTSADFDGNFTLEVPQNSGILVISYVGFSTKEIAYNLIGGKATVNVNLLPDAQSLDEVVVVGTGVVDFVKDRQTPIAATTINAKVIQEKVGNMEFPEILNNSPSVYATKGSGGFGDSRINVRGFDQRNIAVIINGQPVNDMENGKVYWSNWAGLADVASAVQIQRGLGASKLAVPSVGGTINVLTKSADKKQGGVLKAIMGNDIYLKTIVGYNTGLNEKGWSASFLLGRTSGNGYITGLEFEEYSYLASVGYKPSDEHTFNFNITGAAQWHNQRSTIVSIQDFLHFGGEDFRRFNPDWGYREGKGYTFRRNFYNKPIASLNWDWKINEKLQLSSVLYGSWGRGGGTGSRGQNYGIDPYKTDLTDAIGKGKLPYRDPKTAEILFDKIIENNKAGTPFDFGAYKGKVIGANTSLYNFDGTTYNKINVINNNIAIRRSSMNSHDWYGFISNLKYDYKNWSFGAGIDLRSYKGYHYRVVNDLLGLGGYFSTGNKNAVGPNGPYYTKNRNNYNPIGGYFVTETYKAEPFADTGIKGQKIDYYNVGDVKWGGVNFIGEYKDDRVSGVLQVGLSDKSYKRFDFFDQPLNYESKTKYILGGFAKGGVNFNLNRNNNIFFNTGYIERQPNFDAVFPNYQNKINDKVENEKIISYELGYGLRTSIANISLNLYTTKWSNRYLTRSITISKGVEGSANYSGIEEKHQGVEIETRLKPSRIINITGMLSVGKWIYTKNIKADIFDDNRQKIGESTLYLKGAKVGNVAQVTGNIGLEIKPTKNFRFDTSWNYVNDLYSDFDISRDDSFLKPDNKGALKLPSFNLFDAGVSYKFDITRKMNLGFRLNVNNILDTKYISESSTSFRPGAGDKTYQGIDERNTVSFGFGRTWNLGATLRF